MRHGKKFNHLGRTASHRKAMLKNMASSLIIHKRIYTTVAKAKALRKFVEPILTRCKDDSHHNRRIVFSYLQNKEALKELFSEVREKIGDRPGGYTRVIKTDFRKGDDAEMCMIELVDFNELYSVSEADSKKTRRSRRKKKSTDTTEIAPVAEAETVEAEESEANEEPIEEKKTED